MKTAYIYSGDFASYDYGASHPLKPARLRLAYDLTRACGLLSEPDDRVIIPCPATEQDLLAFHTPEYIEILKAANSGRMVPGARRFGLGPGDNPVFPGVLDWSRLVAGGSLPGCVPGRERPDRYSVQHRRGSASRPCVRSFRVLLCQRRSPRDPFAPGQGKTRGVRGYRCSPWRRCPGSVLRNGPGADHIAP